MRMVVLILLTIFTSVRCEDKAVAEKPAEVVHEDLNADEIKYLKDLFRNAVVDTAVNLTIEVQMSKDGDAIVGVTHPQSNVIVKFLAIMLFKDARDMENQIYVNVYGPSASVGKHELNPQGERNYLRSRILEKIRSDSKFFDGLVTVVKEAVK